ncbi:MAG: mechanosensitive ion channel family protein, partial [Myxococcota bacterium]
LRTVKINTLDDDVVSIPNNKFLTDAVSSSNAGELDMMIVLDFHVGVTADHELARQLVFEAAATSRYAFLKKPILVTVEDVSVGGIYATQIRARFYVADTRYELEIRSDVASRVKQAFHDHGVHPPNLLETGLRLTTTPG